MKITDRREAMVDAIRSVDIKGKTYEEYVLAVADKLSSLGAVVPPARIGDTVYAVIEEFYTDESFIEPWEVRGYSVEEDEIYLVDKCGDTFKVGENYCYLTREEAEAKLREAKGREE